MKDEIIVCNCNDMRHALRVSRIDETIYVEMIGTRGGLWHRLKVAWDALFGDGGTFAELVLMTTEAGLLVNALDRAWREADEWENRP